MMLNKGFELAQQAASCESDGDEKQALKYLTAAIEAFSCSLATLPGNHKDLVKREINALQEKRDLLKSTMQASKELETRMQALAQQQPKEEQVDELRARLNKLKGLDTPPISTDELANRLRALKTGETTAVVPLRPPKIPLGDWTKGLDPEVASLIEQVHDETFS